jgi:tRNA threonylcarbamoyladenosine biosynthesis protein TsaB
MAHTLVIDTSYGSTVGVVGHEPVYEPDSRTHVERLQLNIAQACRQAELEPSDLDQIVVGVGPAPFTGLRVGIVAAKALSFATGAELIGQNILTPQAYTLMLAHQPDRCAELGEQALNVVDLRSNPDRSDENATRTQVHHVSLAVNDARRKQLYFELFDGQDMSEPLIGMDIDYPDNIAQRVIVAVQQALGDSDAEFVVDIMGHGAAKYTQSWKAFGDGLGVVVDSSLLDFNAAGVELFAQCAFSQEQANNTVEPLYLRRPDVSVPNPLKHVLAENSCVRSVDSSLRGGSR